MATSCNYSNSNKYVVMTELMTLLIPPSIWVSHLGFQIEGGTKRLSLFENRVLREIIGPKRQRGNRGVENTAWLFSLSVLNTKYYSDVQRKKKKNELGGACSTYGGEENFVYDFGGNLRETDHLGKLRHMWENIIKMGPREIIWTEWKGLIWLRKGTRDRLLFCKMRVNF
jgi:hypothetical protein